MSTKHNFRSPIAQTPPEGLTAPPATPKVRDGEIVAESPAEPHAEGRRERHRRETFERLVSAAREIMFSRGLADMTVQDITEAADVGKGTFFNYFQSKEHVVSRVQEFAGQSLIQAVERVRQRQQTAIEAMGSAIRETMCRPGGNWLTYESNLLRALVMNQDIRNLMSSQLRANRHAYEMLLALGQEQGTVRRDLAVAQMADVAQTLMAGFTVATWIHGTTPDDALVNTMIQALADLMKPVQTKPVQPAERAATAEPGRPTRRAAPSRKQKPEPRGRVAKRQTRR